MNKQEFSASSWRSNQGTQYTWYKLSLKLKKKKTCVWIIFGLLIRMCGYNLCVVPEVLKVPRHQHKARHWTPFLEQSKSAQICQKSRRYLKILGARWFTYKYQAPPYLIRCPGGHTEFVYPKNNPRPILTAYIPDILIASLKLPSLSFKMSLFKGFPYPNCRCSRDFRTRFLFQHSLNKVIRLINVWLSCDPDCDLWCSQMRRAGVKHITLS